ncbi:hypothetical protein K505DRAFT_273497 [Melanomma pulvis-pyrius CBS 109.77]|uniref:Uncharacterized protein n=1 Tax=Melanomma pulvis-pyrius CBS 109.77 TaxID=1314802 RepID=A0A6A6XHC9_9PLEO|nr:hypothetical protein K505DRAFT_273497 [Melanomma pulvis-pyrius CBS 109.77]
MVERDSTGNYSMAAPSTSLNKREVDGLQGGDEESEQENQLIALFGQHNRLYDQPHVLSEVKAALESSLEKKAQSLEHDRWMFEGEGRSKG